MPSILNQFVVYYVDIACKPFSDGEVFAQYRVDFLFLQGTRLMLRLLAG